MPIYTQSTPHHYHGHKSSAAQAHSNHGYGGYRLPPSAQHMYHFDPFALGHAYSVRLSELTVNSISKIEDLTRLAREQSRFSNMIARSIEAHIRRVSPSTKLPAFALLDNIAKSVHIPYAAEFTVFIVPLFLETYSLVDNVTRSKMCAMLRTWRIGSTTGKELFGFGPQHAMERGIWGERGDPVVGRRSEYRVQGSVTSLLQSEVMGELELAVGQQQCTLRTHPQDVAAHTNLTILRELRSVVVGGLSDEVQLNAILNQVRTLMRNTATTSAPSPLLPVHQQPSHNYWNQPSYAQNTRSIAPLSPLTNGAAPLAPPSADSYEILSILTNLTKSGVVPFSAPPIGTGKSLLQETPAEQPDTGMTVESRSYRESILAHSILLTTSDITTPRNHIIFESLYESQPVQCKQCGQRFSGDPAGKKHMEKHLDMHFVQNRQASQQASRGHYRGWFVPRNDWINNAVNVTEKGVDCGASRGGASVAAGKAKNHEDLRAMFVVVPPGDEAKPIRCPVCKEALTSEFLEDAEEWVWKNAIKKVDTVYHATCHSEAATSTSTLVSRLRVDNSRSRSRSLTPEFPGRMASPRSSPPSPLAGIKRKAGPTDQGEEAPSKRVAL